MKQLIAGSIESAIGCECTATLSPFQPSIARASFCLESSVEQYSITLNQACAMLGISRPTAANWIRTGRLQATRKDPSKPKSPYLTTRQACIAALKSPLHTVEVSAGDAHKEEKQCPSSAEVKYGTPPTRRRAGSELRKALGLPTSGSLLSYMTSAKLNCGE